jgi:hypothetical protein
MPEAAADRCAGLLAASTRLAGRPTGESWMPCPARPLAAGPVGASLALPADTDLREARGGTSGRLSRSLLAQRLSSGPQVRTHSMAVLAQPGPLQPPSAT